MNSIETRKFAGPALVTLGSFSAGILIGTTGFLPAVAAGTAALMALCLCLFLPRQSTLGSPIVLILALTAGMFAASVQTSGFASFAVPDRMINQTVTISGAIYGTPQIRNGTTTFLTRTDSLYFEGAVYRCEGIVPCTLLGREVLLLEGDRIESRGVIRKQPQPVRPSFATIVSPPSPYETPYRFITSDSPGGQRIVPGTRDLYERLNLSISGIIDRLPFGENRELFRALAIGDTRRLDPTLREQFTRAGIAHLLAVSGLNVGVLAILALALFRLLRAGNLTRVIGTILLLFLYLGICGFKPPVTRSFIMCTLVLAGGIMGRKIPGEHSLAVAGLIILAVDPLALFGASFQLSFAAVWGILMFYQSAMEFLKRSISPGLTHRKAFIGAASTGVVSLIATIATAPIAAAHFGLFPFLSIPVNMVAVPLNFPILAAGTATLLLASLGNLFAPAAVFGTFLTGLMLSLLVWLARVAASIPFSSVETGAITPLLACSLAVWFFLLSRAPGRRTVQRTAVFLPLLLVLLMTWYPVASRATPSTSAGMVWFLNVGQGDAFLVKYAGGALLIDTGTASAGKTVLVPSLRALEVRKLDALFISHFHDDHTGGLRDILDNFDVGTVFCRENAADSCSSALGRTVTGLAAGDSLSFPGGGMLVLSPPSQGFLVRGTDGENDNSLVLRCSLGETRVLFAGDIEYPVQQALESWDGTLAAEILKMPHHGAAPVDLNFLAEVDPNIAVISCGLNNSYGHPAPETVEALESRGITLLRTDILGAVEVGSGPDGLTVRSLSP